MIEIKLESMQSIAIEHTEECVNSLVTFHVSFILESRLKFEA
jgi:hypothetical protein